jgi:outer membrane protein assembly factor BamB
VAADSIRVAWSTPLDGRTDVITPRSHALAVDGGGWSPTTWTAEPNDLNGGAFFGLDRFTGKEVWRHVGPSDRYGARDVFKVVDGVAYLASNDTYAYAFDPETGRIHWKHDLRASASSSGVCGNYMFAAGSLHMLNRSSGQQEAVLFLDRDGFVQSDDFVVSRLLSHGGRVYFVSYKAVYAVECTL